MDDIRSDSWHGQEISFFLPKTFRLALWSPRASFSMDTGTLTQSVIFTTHLHAAPRLRVLCHVTS
jgi:hypothetical protein